MVEPLKQISPGDVEDVLKALGWRVSGSQQLAVNVSEMRHSRDFDGDPTLQCERR